MRVEKIIVLALITAGLGVLAWSVSNAISRTQNNSGILSVRYQQSVADELPDKCQAPPDYTDEAWQEHMSHHPDRYSECFTAEELAAPAVRNINPEDLALIMEDDNFVLIDTHIPEQAHIPGTDMFIPYDQIITSLAQLPQDKSAPIVLYCRSGNMSREAAISLMQQGYTNVYNLAGGAKAWTEAGYQVEEVQL